MKEQSEPKEKKCNNENHPWKKPFTWKQANIERERRKEMEKIRDKK